MTSSEQRELLWRMADYRFQIRGMRYVAAYVSAEGMLYEEGYEYLVPLDSLSCEEVARRIERKTDPY